MKKALITLAIAATATVAQANTTTLSGQVGYQANFDFGNLSSDDNKVGDSIKNGLENSKITSTKIGIDGTEDFNNGVTAIFGYELGIGENGIDSTKKAFLGFRGDFGEIILGKKDGVFGTYTGKANYFNSDDVFGGWVGSDYSFKSGVRYNAPEFANGVKGSVSYDLAQKLLEAGVGFAAYGLDVGVSAQYKFVDGDKQNSYRAGISAEYSNNMFKAAVDYTFIPQMGDDVFKHATHEIGVGLGYNITDVSTLYAGAQINANIADDGSNPNKNFQIGAGYTYNIGKHTKTWIEAGLNHTGKTSDNANNAVNNFQTTVGIRHQF